MILQCKADSFNEEYKERYEEYEKELEAYNSKVAMYEDDPVMQKAMGSELTIPTPPTPGATMVKVVIRDFLILGYEYNKESNEVMVLVDPSRLKFPSYIIDYDDKIIKQLDELLEKN